LADWLRNEHHPDQALVMAGDFNIAPEEIDVHDPERWRGKVLFSEPEHQRLRALMDWGLTDLHRVFAGDEGIYSWWDYRFGAFARGWGLRIDLVLGTRSVVEGLQSVEVDREERKKSSGEGSPSDHAPVIAMIGGKA
jgi:exodeoxyribonuclease-3